MRKYRFEQNLTDKERYRINLLVLMRVKIIWKMVLILSFPLILVFIVTSTSVSLGTNDSWSDILPGFIMPGIMLAFFLITPIVVIKLKKSNNPVYELDEWGMSIYNNNVTINIPWQDLAEYIESPRYIFITQSNSKLNMHVIQKSAFSNNEEIKEFIDFLISQRLKRK